jgi:hypothetical protein
MLRVSAFLITLSATALSAEFRAHIRNGSVSYTDELGRRGAISVGKECTDLWTSPDGSVMTFVAIEQAGTPGEIPSIERSSIYIARRFDHFTPLRLRIKPILLYGVKWSVFRRPSVSEDGQTLFFEVPDSVVSSTLMSMSLTSGVLKQVSSDCDYCVIWHGAHSGDLLLELRYLPVDPHRGVSYRCYLRDKTGAIKLIAAKCDSLAEFAKYWSRRNGANCTPPVFSEKWYH